MKLQIREGWRYASWSHATKKGEWVLQYMIDRFDWGFGVYNRGGSVALCFWRLELRLSFDSHEYIAEIEAGLWG